MNVSHRQRSCYIICFSCYHNFWTWLKLTCYIRLFFYFYLVVSCLNRFWTLLFEIWWVSYQNPQRKQLSLVRRKMSSLISLNGYMNSFDWEKGVWVLLDFWLTPTFFSFSEYKQREGLLVMTWRDICATYIPSSQYSVKFLKTAMEFTWRYIRPLKLKLFIGKCSRYFCIIMYHYVYVCAFFGCLNFSFPKHYF